MNKKQKTILSLAIIILALVSGSLIYLSISLTTLQEAYQYLESDEKVAITQTKEYEFQRLNTTSALNTTGFILYPGEKVPLERYAALGYGLAAQGLFIAIPKMPFNLAVFSPNVAQAIIEAHPEISTWIIGDHSLGGAMAAKFAYDNPVLIQALVLLAAYPTDSNNLSSRDIDVL